MVLSKRQRQYYLAIVDFIEENGYVPTYAEIKKMLKVNAFSTVHEMIQRLQKKGLVEKGYHEDGMMLKGFELTCPKCNTLIKKARKEKEGRLIGKLREFQDSESDFRIDEYL